MNDSVIPNRKQLLDAYRAMAGTMDIKKNELIKMLQEQFNMHQANPGINQDNMLMQKISPRYIKK